MSLGSITNTQSLNPVKWGNLLAAFSQHPDYAFLVKISHGDAFSKNATAKMENVHLVSNGLMRGGKCNVFFSLNGYLKLNCFVNCNLKT